MNEIYSYELTFDEAEAIGLDGTGRDLDPRFPYTYRNLTQEERVAFWCYRLTGVGVDYRQAYDLAHRVKDVGNAVMLLTSVWHELDLPGDFIVPELGMPVSMSLEEAGMEIWDLGELLESAADESLNYVGRHRKVSA